MLKIFWFPLSLLLLSLSSLPAHELSKTASVTLKKEYLRMTTPKVIKIRKVFREKVYTRRLLFEDEHINLTHFEALTLFAFFSYLIYLSNA